MRTGTGIAATWTAGILFGVLAPAGRAEEPFPAPAADGAATPAVTDAAIAPEPSSAPPLTPVWGAAGMRGYGLGDHIAPNGLEFKALFSLDFDFNFWVWRSQRVYAFADSQFWAQRATPGVTNSTQGVFDFSKREFDLSGGFAWNYYGALEARAFAYSYNNLNRGDSTWQPSGYNDGVGLENRYYLNSVYADLGTTAYDVDRATFISLGFYPSKDMVDSRGDTFKPGLFARAYLTWELLGPRCYLYGDGQFIATQSFTPKVLKLDVGAAARPFDAFPRLEFRIGTDAMFDLQNNDTEPGVYGAVRFTF